MFAYGCFCMAGLTACGGDDTCSHQWGEWSIATNATCTSAAVYFKSCSCGAINTNEADIFTSGSALAHKDEDKEHICHIATPLHMIYPQNLPSELKL